MADYLSKVVQLNPLTVPERAVTRSTLSEEGINLSNKVVPGDFICCEIDSKQEPWMIGLAETAVINHDGPDQNTWMGKIMRGDSIIWAVKLEGSGNVFGETEKRVPIFVAAGQIAACLLDMNLAAKKGRGYLVPCQLS